MGEKVCGKVLDELKVVPNLGQLLHLPEAKTISLVGRLTRLNVLLPCN